MNDQFKNKKILVTGGTSGIGLATIKMIRERGGHVVTSGTNEDHIKEAKDVLCDNCLVLKSDASDPSDIETLMKETNKHFGELDGAFLNAGFGEFSPTEEINESHTEGMINVNFKGVALQMGKLKPLLKKGASVLLTSSVAPYIGMPQGAVYSGTKGAVSAMMRCFAKDLAGEQIRVNAICPGPIETRFFEDAGSNDGGDGMVEKMKSQIPLGRFGDAKEVASLACFLLSDEASYVTGSEYMVDGGMSLR